MSNKRIDDYHDILTVKDIQEILLIGRSKAYELIRTNQIESVSIGKQKRIPKKKLIEFLENKCYDIEIAMAD